MPTKSYRIPNEWIQPNTVVINVSSFKNIDKEAVLKIPGVRYVPLVGKVTVAMLERNLMRLFYNFHHPDHQLEERKKKELGALATPWYGNVLQIYTAVAATVILALSIGRRK